MKVERVSYDVITPSAARGIIEAVYWKPAIRWVIDKIHVLNEIEFTNIRRNEVSEKISTREAERRMNGATDPFFLDATDRRQQRAALVLKNVDYISQSHFEMTEEAGPDDTVEKHYNMILRRLRKGQHFHAPCLGTREFGAKVELIEEGEPIPQSPLGNLDLGWMLYDLDFRFGRHQAAVLQSPPEKRRAGFRGFGGAKMILQALTRYYDILSNDPDSGIALPGYSTANVNYALNLSIQGDLLDIFPLSQQVQHGKKIVDKPLSMIVPEQAGRSGKTPPAYFLCDNNAYVLGISVEDEDNPEYSQQRLETFRAYNKEILSGADCVEARTVIAFLDKYDPVTGRKHPVIAKFLEDILKTGKANFVFMVNGKYFHENAEIRQIWEERNQSSEDSYIGQCLITGKTAPIAHIHDIKIKGIAPYHGGVTLVGFNDRAYSFYNRTKGQGLNSPVSKKAMLAYSKALNHLLSDANKNKKIVIGDTTIVYWAEGNNKACASLFAGLLETEFEEPASDLPEGALIRDRKGENLLKNIAEKVKRGEKTDKEGLAAEINWNTRFYILGLEAPNRGRASIRFFYSDPFIKFVERIGAHYSDLQLGKI